MTGKYVAFTPKEGYWPFTESATPKEAMDKLVQAIVFKKVLSIPIDNPISFRVIEPSCPT